MEKVKYQIKYQGKPYTIMGPPGATREQLMTVFKADLAKKASGPKNVALGDVESEMGKQAKGDLATGIQTGIAKAATKAVRGLGTTLLPASAEAYMERKGLLPTKRDVELLEAGTAASIPAQIASGVSDIAIDALPAAKVLKGAKTLTQALPRAVGLGAASGGIRADEGEVLPEAALGAAGGGLGAAAASGVGVGVGSLVKASPKARNLMNMGIVPTLGEGVDTSRLSGKVLKGLEEQLETMPVAGYGVRAARQQPTVQLFNEASNLAVAPGRTLPTGTRPEVVSQLIREGGESQGAALASTKLRAGINQKVSVDKYIDSLRQKYNLTDKEVGDIKMFLNERVWAGAPKGTFGGQAMEDVKEEIFSGRLSKGNVKLQRAMEDVGGKLKDWTDKSAQSAGFDLPAIRQAQVNAHVLRRAGGSDVGVSGPQLMRGLDVNDAVMASRDTAAREMRDLAENASIIAKPRIAWGNRSVPQLAKDTAGAIPGLAYGAVNYSPAVRKLLMGDPTTRAQFIAALNPWATVVGTQMATDNEE